MTRRKVFLIKIIFLNAIATHKHIKTISLTLQVIIAHATHLFFDHPYEPDPEERGYYWASRHTDTKKVFGYTPDHIIWNADVTSTGVPIAYDDVCEKPGCEVLRNPENIEGSCFIIRF